jgi:hypothetical protein
VRVFIANFGFENYLWPTCHARPSVATLEDEDLRPFSLAGDREGYVAHCIARKKTRTGITPPPSVASRWFSLSQTIASTEDDVWIHREKGELWWTTSRSGAATEELKPAFKGATPDLQMYEIHKPADPWSNKDRRGAKLLWDALHAKARAFLFTEGTLQQLADDNADYALALIGGSDLGAWHQRPAWRAKEESARRGPAKVFDARQRAVVRMAMTVMATVAGAHGQQVQRTAKIKEMRFPNQRDLERYVAALVESQDGLCAVTGIPLQFDGEDEDAELLCSLDRIDSDGHYEPGNLQVVCRFANRWKNDGNNAEFQRLIGIVRNARGSG